MAAILPGSPPVFDKNDVAGTVKALCNYTRALHENLDYLLGQMDKRLSMLEKAAASEKKT